MLPPLLPVNAFLLRTRILYCYIHGTPWNYYIVMVRSEQCTAAAASSRDCLRRPLRHTHNIIPSNIFCRFFFYFNFFFPPRTSCKTSKRPSVCLANILDRVELFIKYVYKYNAYTCIYTTYIIYMHACIICFYPLRRNRFFSVRQVSCRRRVMCKSCDLIYDIITLSRQKKTVIMNAER